MRVSFAAVFYRLQLSNCTPTTFSNAQMLQSYQCLRERDTCFPETIMQCVSLSAGVAGKAECITNYTTGITDGIIAAFPRKCDRLDG